MLLMCYLSHAHVTLKKCINIIINVACRYVLVKVHRGEFNAVHRHCPQKMLQSPYFFFDVIYLHNGADEHGDEGSWKVGDGDLQAPPRPFMLPCEL